MLSLEQEFSIYQANKIKQFVKKSKDKNLDKDTNVSAYFLVVGEIFSHLNDFLKLFPYPYQNKKKCLEFIYHLNIVKKRKISMNDKFYNSMRMTIIELKL